MSVNFLYFSLNRSSHNIPSSQKRDTPGRIEYFLILVLRFTRGEGRTEPEFAPGPDELEDFPPLPSSNQTREQSTLKYSKSNNMVTSGKDKLGDLTSFPKLLLNPISESINHYSPLLITLSFTFRTHLEPFFSWNMFYHPSYSFFCYFFD